MVLNNCVARKMTAGQMNKIRGKKAVKQFNQIQQALVAQGQPPAVAAHLAAQRVVQQTKRAASVTKWRQINAIHVRKALTNMIAGQAKPGSVAVKAVDDIDFEARAIHRQAVGRMVRFLERHHSNIMGNVTDPAHFDAVVKSLHGEKGRSPTADALADAIEDAREYFRIELNKNGHSIPKLKDRGVAHRHDALSIGKVTQDEWWNSFSARLDWSKMWDEQTGTFFSAPPSQARQQEIAKSIYGNIVYGRGSAHPTWGMQGEGNSFTQHRVLHFLTAQDWIDYNKQFGGADPFTSLMGELEDMSREVAIARKFGASPEIAARYMGDLATKELRDQGAPRTKAMIEQGKTDLAERMLRVMRSTAGPTGHWGAVSARFFSTTRKLLTAAFLDRAAVISIPSDMNSARLSANAIGMNKDNVISTYLGLMQDSLKGGGDTRQALLQQMHIADSFANPSVTMNRYQQEFPAARFAEVLSNASMQIGGIQAHTDNLKLAWQKSMAGHFHLERGKRFDQLDDSLKRSMTQEGVTEEIWDKFRLNGGEFTAPNGGKFLDPLVWRETTTLPPDEAQEVFLAMQSFVEKWTERAVPTRSMIAQGFLNPRAFGLPPGSVPYEVLQSGTMFKSFLMAFVVNQVRMVNLKPTRGAKWAYVAEMVGTATMVGAVAMQVNELLMGRDPQPMDNDDFWWRAMLRGGGLGPVGDVLFAGTASWGGGLPSYIAGPIPQAAGDVTALTFGNVLEAYTQLTEGEDLDLNLAKEIARFGRRYTPMGQSPVLLGGAAADRLIWDQFQSILDPDAEKDFARAARNRVTNYGNAEWWSQGEPLPGRAPDLGASLGSLLGG